MSFRTLRGLKKIKEAIFSAVFSARQQILTYYGNLIVPLVYCIIISLYGSNDLKVLSRKVLFKLSEV